jgi:hypothetical protein
LGFTEIVGAIVAGNLITAAFLAAFSRALRQENRDISWLTLAGLGLPLLLVLGALATAEGPPPFLAAIAAQ